MDFASALAKLEKSANAVKKGDNNNNNKNAQGNRGSSSDRHRGGAGGSSSYPPQDHRRRRVEQDDHHHHNRRNQRPRQQSPPPVDSRNSSPCDGMIRFGYRLSFRTSTNNNNPAPPPPTRHIALLALTIDDLPYEHIWRAWIQTAGKATVSLLCHAKFPAKVTSPWLRQRLLVKRPRMGRGNSYADPEYKTFTPEWGSVQLTRAMVELMASGLEIGNDREKDRRFSASRFVATEKASAESIPPADSFIFISETCLPVRTLAECEQEIYDNNGVEQLRSWVLARNHNTPGTPQNKYERDQFREIHRMIPQQMRWKADQWILLSRIHAEAIREIDRHMRPADQLWNSFAKISASDEMYFPTTLAILGILSEGDSPQMAKKQVTYVDWSEGMRNPATYSQGLKDWNRVARLARANGSLFARKFVPALAVPGQETVITGAIDVDAWKAAVENLAEEAVNKKLEQQKEQEESAAVVAAEIQAGQESQELPVAVAASTVNLPHSS